MTARAEAGGPDKGIPFSVTTEIEFTTRGDAELFRLEVERLARRYSTAIGSFHLERRLD